MRGRLAPERDREDALLRVLAEAHTWRERARELSVERVEFLRRAGTDRTLVRRLMDAARDTRLEILALRAEVADLQTALVEERRRGQ